MKKVIVVAARDLNFLYTTAKTEESLQTWSKMVEEVCSCVNPSETHVFNAKINETGKEVTIKIIPSDDVFAIVGKQLNNVGGFLRKMM